MKIKICGITNLKDAKLAASLGADMLGFNFYKKSPRYITPKKAKQIIDKLPSSIIKVGVFVNSSIKEIKSTKKICKLDLIQLHGDEEPSFCRTLKKKVIKAFRIKDKNDILSIKKYKPYVKAVLLDTYQPNIYGGTGKTFNWKLAKEAKKYKVPIILSGGLNPDNIKEAIKTTQPYAIDICSGIEKSPGKKDIKKMKQLIGSCVVCKS